MCKQKFVNLRKNKIKFLPQHLFSGKMFQVVLNFEILQYNITYFLDKRQPTKLILFQVRPNYNSI